MLARAHIDTAKNWFHGRKYPWTKALDRLEARIARKNERSHP